MVRIRLFGAVDIRDADGQALEHVLRQPKRVALCAYLAAATPRGYHSRDVLLALFWPEFTEAQARHALNQSLHFLRCELGHDVIATRGVGDVGFDSTAVTCDVWAFDRALADGELEAAVTLYQGPFLGELQPTAGAEFEQWVERERSRLLQQYAAALEQLAREAMERGVPEASVRWWRLLTQCDPYGTRVSLELMKALAAAGERAEALAYAEEHARRLRDELETEPAPEVAALADQLRRQPAGVTPAVQGAAKRTQVQDVAPGASDRLRREHAGPRLTPGIGTAAAVAAVGLLIAGATLAWLTARVGNVAPAPAEPPPYTIVSAVDGSAPVDVRNAVRTLVAIRLDESDILLTVPDGSIERGLVHAGMPETTQITVRVARELAVRGAVRTVVHTTLDQLGSAYALTIRVLQAEDGAPTAGWSAEVEGDDHLIRAVSTAVDELSEALRERRRDVVAQRDVREAATPSFEAFQLYIRALERNRALDYTSCIELARRALAIDPEFADARLLLAAAHYDRGDWDSSAAQRARALESGDRLSPGRWHAAEGFSALERGDYVEAQRLYTLALRTAPVLTEFRHDRAHFVVAGALGRYDEAAEELERVRAMVPFGPTQLHVLNGVRTLIAAGRFAEADSLAGHLGPEHTGLRARSAMMVHAARHEWDALDSTAVLGGSSWWPFARASTAAARGRMHAARGYAKEAGTGLWRADRARWLLELVAEPMSNEQVPVDSLAETLTWRGVWSAARGDLGEAQRYLHEARARGEAFRGFAAAVYVEPLTKALVSRYRGHYGEAIGALTQNGVNVWPGQIERWWLLGDAYERMSRRDSAAYYFERLTASGGLFREENVIPVGIVYSFVHFRLGRLYTALGADVRAEEHYVAFLETFTDPDYEYAWMVTEAHEELARSGRRM